MKEKAFFLIKLDKKEHSTNKKTHTQRRLAFVCKELQFSNLEKMVEVMRGLNLRYGDQTTRKFCHFSANIQSW
jgi:hypothetical protein